VHALQSAELGATMNQTPPGGMEHKHPKANGELIPIRRKLSISYFDCFFYRFGI
jgi:hypothetical protein